MIARIVNARVSLRAGGKHLKIWIRLIASHVMLADLVCMILRLSTWSCYIPVLFGSCSIDWYLAWKETVDLLFNIGWLLESNSKLYVINLVGRNLKWNTSKTAFAFACCILGQCPQPDHACWVFESGNWTFLMIGSEEILMSFFIGRKMCSKFFFEFTMQILSTRLHDLSGKRSCRNCKVCACLNMVED